MSENNSKSLIELKHKKLLNNDQGFSLLELVTAVGAVLVLSLVGLLSYNGITKNARQAAVNNTADTVYSRAMAYETDANPNTNYQTALEEYNKASGSLDNDNTKKSITVEGTRSESNSLRIRAFYTNDESIEAIKITPSSSTNNNDAGGNDTVITPPSETISTETVLKYRCDEDYETTFPNSLGHPKMGLDSDAVVQLTGNGESLTEKGAGIQHTMIAGVEYTVTINGKFNTLTGNKCLRSIESIGNNSDVTRISYLGENITKVPNQIPSSVTSMNTMFLNNSSFNQDISGWDVSNVRSMDRMFENATAFNNDDQPLDWGNKTASVEHMNEMFLNASSFNQDISGWNVGNVTNMSLMFQGATKFNQDISSWDVSKVTNMNGMFTNAMAFNRDISDWDVSNVRSMGSMFYNASSFNQDISGWDVGNVSYYSFFANGSGIASKPDYKPKFG